MAPKGLGFSLRLINEFDGEKSYNIVILSELSKITGT